jgi:hypothetical protein
MAVKRKIRKGLATDLLCTLRHQGAAKTEWLAKRLGYSVHATDRALMFLASRDLIGLSPMHPGKWSLYPRGASVLYKTGACPVPREGSYRGRHDYGR